MFFSNALLEKMVGISTAVWGEVELDPQNLKRGIKAAFEVDIRAFETGMTSRNHFLKHKIFEVSKYPVIGFKTVRLVKMSKVSLKSGKAVSVEMEGIMSFRGISNREQMRVLLTYLKKSATTRQRLSGNLLKIETSFELDLSKYQVSIPKDWNSRLSQIVLVQVDAIGSDQSPALQLNLPQGVKLKEPQVGEKPAPSK